MQCSPMTTFFFFFNDTATTEIYTLSLHDALPISPRVPSGSGGNPRAVPGCTPRRRALSLLEDAVDQAWQDLCELGRSEEHTSELQSRQYLVCRLLLEKKKQQCNHYVKVMSTRTRY